MKAEDFFNKDIERPLEDTTTLNEQDRKMLNQFCWDLGVEDDELDQTVDKLLEWRNIRANEFAKAYAKQSSPSVPFISPELLAEWMHNNYEEIALNNGWKTQEDCQVPFHELPKENKVVMLELAERLLSKPSNWVSVEDRLPEVYTARSSDWVLVLTRDGAQHIATYNHKYKDWDSNSSRADIVTHWQPLPEPPKK